MWYNADEVIRMCGRYYVDVEREEMERIVEAVNRALLDREVVEQMRTGEIRPTNIAPVYVNSDDGAAVTLMRWGFPGFKNPEKPNVKPRPIINARSETVQEKRSFSKYLGQRCLVPATSYFEWTRPTKDKTKYEFWREDKELLYMAAIFREVEDSPVSVFTILTRDASAHIQTIHDRMPVILGREGRRAWMRGDVGLGEVFGAAEEGILFKVA